MQTKLGEPLCDWFQRAAQKWCRVQLTKSECRVDDTGLCLVSGIASDTALLSLKFNIKINICTNAKNIPFKGKVRPWCMPNLSKLPVVKEKLSLDDGDAFQVPQRPRAIRFRQQFRDQPL